MNQFLYDIYFENIPSNLDEVTLPAVFNQIADSYNYSLKRLQEVSTELITVKADFKSTLLLKNKIEFEKEQLRKDKQNLEKQLKEANFELRNIQSGQSNSSGYMQTRNNQDTGADDDCSSRRSDERYKQLIE